MITLQNKSLRAVIATKGAELQSLINNQTGIEYMWNGNAAFWGKHSPVLFPIVGSLKNDTYYFNDKAYRLPRHGFAREKVFAVEIISESEAVFTITDDEDTLKVYPFSFTLQLRYTLTNSLLTCTYQVINSGNKELLFSIGAHPAFAVPETNGITYDDYYLQFNKTEQLYRWKLKDGLIAENAAVLPLQDNKLSLSKKLFYEDAIVLKDMQSHIITLGCNKHYHGINFSFDDFPFFGIWAAKDAPFICLEPWCGIADSVMHNQQLKDKEGIQTLATGKSWKRSWSVECF